MKTMLLRLCGPRAGSALVTVMGVIILVALVGAGMVTLGRQQIHSARRLRDYAKAQIIAESGVNAAYCVLKTNFTARNDPSKFPLTQFGDGSYDATVLPISSNLAAITSTGLCGLARAVARADIKNFPLPGPTNQPPLPQGAFAYAVVSGDTMTWNGNGTMTINGAGIHSNSRYKMTGCEVITGQNCNVSSSVEIWSTGTTKIHGNAQAPAWKGSSPANVIGGTPTTGAVSLVSIPDIDLTPYYQSALAYGQVYNGDIQLTGSTDLVVPGGIMWVNGTLRLNRSGPMVGCFIATGDIIVTGSGDQEKVAGYPAFVSRDGKVDLSGSGDVHGLVYAKSGSIQKTGNGVVVGSMICAGTFDKGGGWDLLVYENSTPVPPNNPNTSGRDRVVITAWQE